MMFFKVLLVIGLFTSQTMANCPYVDNPADVIECLSYISTGLYGAVTQDLKKVCRIATDIARCAKDQIGQCIAAEIGRAALAEVESLAKNCCPERNNANCPIKDSALSEQRCFSADSFVTLINGQTKPIVDLRSGDAVLAFDQTNNNIVHTQVITMLDFQPQRFALFKQITTNTGRQISLTSAHLILTQSNQYLMAKDVQNGMNIFIMNSDGELVSEKVSNVSDVVKQGYVAPLTQQGTIIVNNIAASCYGVIKSHDVAHAVLAPMRWWYGWFGMSTSASSEEVGGVHWFPKMLYEMTAYMVPSILHQ